MGDESEFDSGEGEGQGRGGVGKPVRRGDSAALSRDGAFLVYISRHGEWAIPGGNGGWFAYGGGAYMYDEGGGSR